ncbi:MAG: hypothetical protein IJX46_02800 [Clostridia bacterium]|nr:hypothetical protein [Clostridia bacterium]
MSQKNCKTYRARLLGSSGIDRSAYLGEDGWERIENFRIDPSGALIKRPGRRKYSTLPYPAVDVIPHKVQGKDGKSYDLFALTPPYVTAISSSDGSYSQLERDLVDDGRKMNACLYDGDVYLTDANALKRFRADRGYFLFEHGYAPLYGRGWDPETRGEIRESPNLLGNNIRINYKVGEAAASLSVGLTVKSVTRVEINGVSYSDFTVDGTYISGTFPENSEVDVWLNCDFPRNYGFTNCYSSAVVGSGEGERMVCFNSKQNPPMIYCSRPVDEESFEASVKGFPDTSRLYFPAELSLRIGNLGRAVTAICPCNGGFAVFTDSAAFYARFEDGRLRCSPISSNIGCVARRAVIFKNGLIYTACDHGIYVFDIDAAAPERTTVTRISDPIAGEEDFRIDESCMILDNEKDGELWFRCPEHIFIYNLKFKRFFAYTNMPTSLLLATGGRVLLFNLYDMWGFDDSLFLDVDGATETHFTANARTRWLCLGEPEVKKSGAEVCTVFKIDGGGRFNVGVETNSGFSEPHTVLGRDTLSPDVVGLRVSRCRFTAIRVALTSYEDTRPRIFELNIKAHACTE